MLDDLAGFLRLASEILDGLCGFLTMDTEMLDDSFVWVPEAGDCILDVVCPFAIPENVGKT